MAYPLALVPGREQRAGTPYDEEERAKTLLLTVEKYLPEFVKAVEAHDTSGVDVLILHQDAFAAGYHTDEYTLLGAAIKYAGRRGIPVMITGKNHETF